MRTIPAADVQRMMKIRTLWGWLYVRAVDVNKFGDRIFSCDRSDGKLVYVLRRADEPVQVRDRE